VSLLERVEQALDSVHPLSGCIICAGGRVVATRQPAPGGGAWLIVLDHKPRPVLDTGKLDAYRAQPRRSFLHREE